MSKKMGNGATKVLFVCLGNICRSPTAQSVFAALVDQQGLAGLVEVDSCGTGDWHVGSKPDRRAIKAAAQRGYDLSGLRGRQVHVEDFYVYDYILAMDGSNLEDLLALCPADYRGHLGLFLSFAGENVPDDVPDPYYGGGEGFDRVLDLIEAASEGLLQVLSNERPRRSKAPST
jgi:protein-tyrosine phosphatase